MSISTYEIPVPLSVGDWVTLYDEATVEYRPDGRVDGGTAKILFEGAVEQYVPETGKLRFAEDGRSEDIGRAEFLDYLDEANGIEILYDYEDQ